MPVLIDLQSHGHHLAPRIDETRALLGKDAKPTNCLNIGLVNNMPDAALVSTERQLFELLTAAAGEFVVRLHLYTMETTPRTDWGRDYVRRFYLNTGDLLNNRLDGLIVTGAEPKAPILMDEPYWPSFVQVIDWAKENTLSSVYSCLAVHGATLHLDKIERRALPRKCLGVFTQTKVTDHPLMLNVPATLKIPHSRWNEVQEGSLAGGGYTILSRSDETGADCFVKQHGRSLFVYFQGHPEYEAQSLLGEYRRDIGRFLRQEAETYPAMPSGYFSKDAEETLTTFECDAVLDRRAELLTNFPVDQLAKGLRNTWHSAAMRMYRNWILYMLSENTRPRERRSRGMLSRMNH
jgi:homoserine O-succinyltransferase